MNRDNIARLIVKCKVCERYFVNVIQIELMKIRAKAYTYLSCKFILVVIQCLVECLYNVLVLDATESLGIGLVNIYVYLMNNASSLFVLKYTIKAGLHKQEII